MAQPVLELRHAQEQVNKPKFRADIQGLRAMAVTAVILNHLLHWPIGGYLGVDVFFVISGFIITSLLLRQYQAADKISFADFYRRRVKRILPASSLVLVVTVAASFLIFRAGRAMSILTDATWSALFVGNWRFATSGTDYWASDGTVSPLQHYWSLGVEEQFYFVWPLLILITFMFARTGKRAMALAFVLILLGAPSFVWATHETVTNGTWAYFSTVSRAWELAVGALLAVCGGALVRIPEPMRPLLAWLGLGGIVASLFVFDSGSPIPAPGAALPVMATALVIAAGTGGKQRFLGPLTNPISGYLGNISFSLYLWHFPCIILGGYLLNPDTPLYLLATLTTMIALSTASYHFVENPIRRSTWLEARSKSNRGRRLDVGQKVKYVGLGFLALVTAATCVMALIPKTASGPAQLTSVVLSNPTPSASVGAVASTAQAQLTAEINVALAQTSWPDLSPSVDDLMSQSGPDEDKAGCSESTVSDQKSCSFPTTGATKNAVVLGDSTGITLLPTVRQALGDAYNVRGLTMAGCVPLDIAISFESTDKQTKCEQHKTESVAEVNRTRPDVVFVTTMYGYINDLASKTPGHLAGQAWQSATESLVRQLAPSKARVVIVGSPPLGKPLLDCFTNFSKPSDCQVSLSVQYEVTSEAYSAAATATGAAYIDTRRWFCNDEGLCPAFVGTTPLKRDQIHTTRQYAGVLAPIFKDELKKIGLGA